MTDIWMDPADALFTNPDWEDPFPYEEGWPVELVGPEYLMALGLLPWEFDGYEGVWCPPDFYAPRARWVSDR